MLLRFITEAAGQCALLECSVLVSSDVIFAMSTLLLSRYLVLTELKVT